MHLLRKLIERVDLEAIDAALTKSPVLANRGIPTAEDNEALAHPLHRICDGVFSGQYSDSQAAEMARLFLAHGASIHGFGLIEKADSPLTAAASLGADEVAMLYIEKGSNIHHRGCHGGTALHWSAWCGRERVVRRLIEVKADVHARCIDFNATPLFWAVHGFVSGGEKNKHHQIECVRLLIEAGAEKDTRNREGMHIKDLISPNHPELLELLA